MKKSSILLFIFCSFFIANAAEKKEYKHRLTMGISLNAGVLSKFKDENIATSSLVTEVSSTVNMDLQISLYNDNDEILKKYKQKNLDTIIIDTVTYFNNKNKFDFNSDVKWGIKTDDKTFSKYYLIANKSKKLKGFKDLKNKKLVVNKDDNLAKIWLDKNSYENNKSSARTLVSELKQEKNYRRVVFNVFFGKSDFGIVTQKAWDVIVSFNPAIKNKVQILKSSEEIFLENIGVYSKSSDKETREYFFEKGLNPYAIDSEKSKDMLRVMKINGLYVMEDGFLNRLEQFFDEYFKLEKRYN